MELRPFAEMAEPSRMLPNANANFKPSLQQYI